MKDRGLYFQTFLPTDCDRLNETFFVALRTLHCCYTYLHNVLQRSRLPTRIHVSVFIYKSPFSLAIVPDVSVSNDARNALRYLYGCLLFSSSFLPSRLCRTSHYFGKSMIRTRNIVAHTRQWELSIGPSVSFTLDTSPIPTGRIARSDIRYCRTLAPMSYNSRYKLFADYESSLSMAMAKPMSADVVVGLPIPGPGPLELFQPQMRMPLLRRETIPADYCMESMKFCCNFMTNALISLIKWSN